MQLLDYDRQTFILIVQPDDLLRLMSPTYKYQKHKA